MLRARPLALACLLALALLGCERKAPGPEECARFAEAAAGPARAGDRTLEEQAHIDAATRECLTEPYDYQLLHCVLVTRQTRSCLDGFHKRRAQRG